MTLSAEWLIDQSSPLTKDDLDDISRQLAGSRSLSRGKQSLPPLAVSLHDVRIHDNRKWFGEADIRVDALVITGYGTSKNPRSFYMPKTASFPRIRDGEMLPLDLGGLLMFHGPAAHFLDVRIMVSRDRRDSENLAQLLTKEIRSSESSRSLSTLFGIAVAAPQVAAVTGAIQAAAALGDIAFRLLQAATGATIGLYRGCHLQYRDGFGIGRHPEPDGQVFRVKDLSFWYDITEEGPPTVPAISREIPR